MNDSVLQALELYATMTNTTVDQAAERLKLHTREDKEALIQ